MDVIGPRPDEVLIEIGAGKGALTCALAERAGRVIAVEKDSRLIPPLKERVPGNVEVVAADVLRLDFRRLPGVAGAGRLRAVGNLPYSISTPLVFKILEDPGLFAGCVFLVQKEVAERMIAGPGSKRYAPLSILVQNYFEARIAFAVPPGAFAPPPKVMSALLTLDRRPVPLYADAGGVAFRAFLRAAFAERRKMLWNNLAREAAPDRLAAAYSALGLERNVRAEQLSPDILHALYRTLHA